MCVCVCAVCTHAALQNECIYSLRVNKVCINRSEMCMCRVTVSFSSDKISSFVHTKKAMQLKSEIPYLQLSRVFYYIFVFANN